MKGNGHIWFLLLIISGLLPCYHARVSDTAITNDDSKLKIPFFFSRQNVSWRFSVLILISLFVHFVVVLIELNDAQH